MGLRFIKTLLSFSVAVWAIVAGIINLMSYESGIRTVAWVLTLEGTSSFRAISIPIIHHLGYAFIYVGKFIAGFYCAWGTYNLWVTRAESAEVFELAKTKTLIGCGVLLFTYFFGFITIAGTMFQLANNNPSDFAVSFHRWTTFYICSIGLISVYISMREPGR